MEKMEKDFICEPEYTGGPDDVLEQRYLDQYIPVQDDDSGFWCVQTGYGFESGDVDYIAAEFSGTGLMYHFMYNGEMDHTHGFESVLTEVLQDPEHIDIVTDYGEYSEQEIQMVKGIKRAVAFVQSHHRPMIYAMSDIHGCLKELQKQMEWVDLGGDNRIVFLGDYIDYGNSSYQVLQYILDLQREYGKEKIIVLKGNHEEMFLEWIDDYRMSFIYWRKMVLR